MPHERNATPGPFRERYRSAWNPGFRDTLYREDNSTVRTRSGPRAMATLRNLAVGALHLAGRHDTTEATRNMGRPVTIPGLTSRSR